MQELLALRAAHRPGVGLHDDVLEAEPREDALVCRALSLVGGLEPLVGDIERVGVLHGELAPAEQAGARTRLVAVLVLDLVDRQGQILVAVHQVFDEEGEDLFVCRGQDVAGLVPVVEPEHAVAVLGVATRDLVGLLGKKRGEMHLVRAGGGHLLADDVLDARLDPQADGQPGEDARSLPADVAAAHEQAMAGDLRIGGIFAEGTEEIVAEAD